MLEHKKKKCWIAKQELDLNFGSPSSKEWTWSWETQVLVLSILTWITLAEAPNLQKVCTCL